MTNRSILFLLPEFPNLGGTEKSTARLASLLASRGHDVHIYARKGGMTPHEFGVDPRVKLQFALAMECPETLARYVEERKIDIVINAAMIAPGVNRMLQKFRELSLVPIISVLHYSPVMTHRKPLSENEGGILKRMVKLMVWPLYERHSYRRYRLNMQRAGKVSDCMVVLCPDYVPKMESLLGTDAMPPGGIVSIINSIDPAKKLAREDEAGGGGKRIVYCGRLWEHTKRFSRVLRIWARTAPIFPDWELDVVGDGPDMERYKGYVARKGIERVNFIGYTPAPREYMRRGSILLLVSDREGMVLVVPEAQTEGCVPVIYDSFDSARYLIESGEDGLLIPPFDVEEFIRGLHRLMQSPEELARMSRNAVRNSVKYASGPVLDQWETLMERLIDERY